MYFLAKNLRICSNTFQKAPDKLKLYKHGVLNWEYLAKNVSYFLAHPEQIKQRLKERDAHMLCQFFDSEEYKKRVIQFLEMQGRMLAKDNLSGTNAPSSVKYQHVLSCAQPTHKKRCSAENDGKAEMSTLEDPSRKRKVKRGTIFDEMIKRKGNVEIRQDSDCAIVKRDAKPRKFRHRSTIMPIFLKKIKQRRQADENERDEEESQQLMGPSYQTARHIKKSPRDESVPILAQILHRSEVYAKNTKVPVQNEPKSPIISKDNSSINTAERMEVNPIESHKPNNRPRMVSKIPLHYVAYKLSPSKNVLEMVEPPNSKFNISSNENSGFKLCNKSKLDHPPYRLNTGNSKLENLPPKFGGGPSNVVPLRMSSSTAKISPKAPTIKLCPRKNMNLKSYSEFLCTEPVRARKSKKEKSHKGNSEKNLSIEILGKRGEKEIDTKKRVPSIQLLMEQVQRTRSLKFDDSLERKNTMVFIMKNKSQRDNSKPGELELTSLFNKVKLGTSKKSTPSTIKTNEIKSSSIFEDINLKPKFVETPKDITNKSGREQESFTYKIVAKNRERREAKLRKKFKMNPPYWQNTFNLSFGKPVELAEKGAKDLEGMSTKKHFMNFEEAKRRTRTVTTNIHTNLNRPVPHFVDHDNPKTADINRYLIRLPKSTPEGHRVLLYAVRDPDPTKMNFNDVVKGFCMYNDCVLSEDGLQEGYIVIFDMKDVSIGHLARVSLPALKCFMYYIQDAHPCRIKQIHVLNTASWIHHVMRLVVPLVRSELLNLVKFHKGRLPDGIPTELLPMDYGGEAPTIEELDRSTKSLLGKYRDWLIESVHLKADESKRIRKGGWLGWFSSKSPQQVELDEKNILRNLQID